MKIPSIIIKEDLDQEVRQFLRGLHHEQFPWLKNLISFTFPELVQSIKKSPDREEQLVRSFIIGYRKKHEEKIKQIIKESKLLLDSKSEEALISLANVMDYAWPENHPGYIIIPVILPHSPYGENIIYFSLLGSVFGNKKPHDVLFISIHEISHMILHTILKEDHAEQFASLNFHYLKEILAAVLMNQKPLKDTLGIKEYFGNDNLHEIYTLDGDEKVRISVFFQRLYEKLKYEKKKSFKEILSEMSQIIVSIKDELKEKKELWNKYSRKTLNGTIVPEGYDKPIKLSNQTKI